MATHHTTRFQRTNAAAGLLALGSLVCSLHPATAAQVVEIGGISVTIPEACFTESARSSDSHQSCSLVLFKPMETASALDEGSDFLVLEGVDKKSATEVMILKSAVQSVSTQEKVPKAYDGLKQISASVSRETTNSVTVGAHVGLPTFYGASLGWRFSDHFGLRTGYDWFTFSRGEALSDVTYDIKLKMQSEPLLLDLYPWKKRSFRMSAGVLFNQNSLKSSLTPTSEVTLGGRTYTDPVASGVGSIDLKVKQRSVCPMVTIGGNVFYFDSAHHWAFSSEVGAYFAGKPDVQLSTTSSDPTVIQDVEAEKQKIKDDIGSKLNIIPLVKLGVNFSF